MSNIEKIKHSALSEAVRDSKPLLLLGFLLIFSFSGINAQFRSDWKSVLEQRLETSSPVNFLHLVGYFDELLYADMYFAYDTVDWVGVLTFPDTELYFNLEGMGTQDQVVFNEYDSVGRQTGYWTIQKNLNRYIAIWKNIEQSMDFETIMFDEFWNPDYRKDFHKKLSSYTGFIQGKPLEFDIIRQHALPVSMEWFDLVDFNIDQTDWECQDIFCSKFSVSPALPLRAEALHSLVGEEVRDELNWNYSLASNEKQIATFTHTDDRFTQLKAIIELDQLIIVEFPVLEDKLAAKTIERITNFLLDSLQNQIIDQDKSEQDYSNRWNRFAHVWFEIHYWDDDFLSGKWVIQRNWTDEQWSVPINFHTRDHEFIDIRSEFKSEFDIDFFLDHFAQNGIKFLPEYKDLLIRNKLQNAEFKYLNFCKAGLLLSTGFDTIFGSFQLIVPYGEVDQYLRKRSLLKELLQSR